MKRILEFDGIRAIAIIMIFACHICYGLEANSPFGQYLGGTYNCVFFLVSSLLMGTKSVVPDRFFTKRVLRLGNSLWPFLLITLLVYTLFGIKTSWISWAANVFMLGWFFKIPGLGHLWFVTMIMACYVLFWTIWKCGLDRKLKTIVLLVFSVTLQFVLEQMNYPGYFGLVLLYSGCAFMYAKDLLEIISKINLWIITAVMLLVHVCCLFMLYEQIIRIGNLDYYYVTTLCGITAFFFLFRLFKLLKPSKMLVFLSGISYELYLVHHPFCNVKAFTDILGSEALSVVVIVLLSLILAWGLNRLAQVFFENTSKLFVKSQMQDE